MEVRTLSGSSMSSQEASPKSLPSAKEDLLPPRPTAVGPKIPGTGNLVVVWQLEGPPEEDLSLRKIAFEPAKDAKVVTAVPEDVPIGMNTETWMSMSNGKDGSVAGTITADLVSQLGSVEAQVSLALSAEERLLTLVDTSRTELSSSCREDEPPVRVVIKDAVFVVALVQAQEGVSSIIEARVTLIGRLPKVVGLDGVDGDAPHVALRYGRECGPIRLIVKVGDRDLSSEDDGVTSRVTPALPPGIELEKRGCVLRGVPRLSGRSQHSIVVTTAVGESEPFRIAIEVNIEESDMTRLRWAAAEGGLGIAAITDRISKGSPQRASEIYRHFAYTLPEHQQRQREFWAREKRDVIVVDASMSGKLQEIIDDPHHSDGDTTTRVLQLIPGTYTLPEGMLRLRRRRVIIQGLCRHGVTIIGQIRVEHPGCIIDNLTLANFDVTKCEASTDGELFSCGIVITTESNGSLPVCTIQNCSLRCLRSSCVKFMSPPTEKSLEAPGGAILLRNRFSVVRDSSIPAVDFREASGPAIENSALVDNLFSPLCYGLECKKGHQPRARGNSTFAMDTFNAQMMLSASLHPPQQDFNVALLKHAATIPRKAEQPRREELPPRAQPAHTFAELNCCYGRKRPDCVYIEAASTKANAKRSEQLGFRADRHSFYTFCGKSDAWRKRQALNKEPNTSPNLRAIMSRMRGSKASLVWKLPDNGRIRTDGGLPDVEIPSCRSVPNLNSGLPSLPVLDNELILNRRLLPVRQTNQTVSVFLRPK